MDIDFGTILPGPDIFSLKKSDCPITPSAGDPFALRAA
jgi:hypothetical protein